LTGLPNRTKIARMNANHYIPSAWLQPSLHSTYLTLFAQFIQAQAEFNFTPPLGDARLLPFIDYVPLLEMVDAANHPETGIALGLNVPVVAHGPMTIVAQSSYNLHEVMHMLVTCNAVRNRMQRFSLRETETQVIFRIGKDIDLAPYASFVNLAVIFGLFNIIVAFFSPTIVSQAQLRMPMKPLSFDLKPYYAKPPQIIWDSDELAIVFSQSVARTVNPFADSNMLHHNLMAVNAELARLDGNMASKVKFILNKSHPKWASIEKVADELAVSGRTLMRKLKDENTSYQNLLDEAKDELACWYLGKTNLSLIDIAERIGFSDYSNFTRLFKRLHAMTPNEYRLRRQFHALSEKQSTVQSRPA